MSASEIVQQIETFKKGVPFTLQDLTAKFGKEGGKIFLIGVYFGKIHPTGKYKLLANSQVSAEYLPQGTVATTPYFVFV